MIVKLRYAEPLFPKKVRDDEEPAPMGIWRAVFEDVKHRFMVLTGYSVYFPKRWTIPGMTKARFIRWCLWDKPIEDRAKLDRVHKFYWEN